MRLKFALAILIYLTAAVFGTTVLISYFNESERRNLVDLRLETYLEKLREIDFTDKSAEEIEEADTLSRELKSAGLVWVWTKGAQQFFGGAKSFGPRVDAICPNPGRYTVVTPSLTSVRCFREFDRAEKKTVLVASILPKGTEPFFLSTSYLVYVGLILVFGLIFSWSLLQWVLAPFHELRTVSVGFLERVRNGSLRQHLQKNQLALKPVRSPKAWLSDDYNQLIADSYSFVNQLSKWVSDSELRSAQMFHELKTPLTVICNQLDEWTQSSSGERFELQKSQIEELRKRIEDLVRFTDRFRTYINLDSVPLEVDSLHSVDVGSLVEKIARDLNSGHHRVQVEGTTHAFRVLAEPLDLEHLLQNLITNALKYSEGPVTIRMNPSRAVQVIDRGSGLEAAVVDRLGEPFNRGRRQGPSTLNYGHGLGLSIVYAICRRYEWNITYRRESDGQTVWNVQFTNDPERQD